MNANTQISAPTEISKQEQFLDRICEHIDNGAVCIMLSLGHRLGLFDTLANLPASTSVQIADAAQLNERYVREWLAVMVVADIIEYNPATETYLLPAEHSLCLTSNTAISNMAVYAQFVVMAGEAQQQVMACFRTGQGLKYQNYPCFHAIMAEDSGQTVAANITEIVNELAPYLLPALEKGIDVLDAGCGSGHILMALAARFPNSRFVGYDLCADVIQSAQQRVSEQNLVNIEFKVMDLTLWRESNRFDLITSFDAVHDLKEPQLLLTQIQSALKPEGTYLMQDIGGSAHLENNTGFPFAALLYTISTVHCTPISLGQGGEGLGSMWGWETASKMLQQARFSAVERQSLASDPMNVWFVSRK